MAEEEEEETTEGRAALVQTWLTWFWSHGLVFPLYTLLSPGRAGNMQLWQVNQREHLFAPQHAGRGAWRTARHADCRWREHLFIPCGRRDGPRRSPLQSLRESVWGSRRGDVRVRLLACLKNDYTHTHTHTPCFFWSEPLFRESLKHKHRNCVWSSSSSRKNNKNNNDQRQIYIK